MNAFIIGLIIVLIILILGFVFIRAIVKAILFCISVLLIALILFGLLVLADSKQLDRNFKEGGNIFILEKDSDIKAVFSLYNSTLVPLSSYDKYEDAKYTNYAEFTRKGYRVFIMNESVFDNLKDNMMLYFDTTNVTMSAQTLKGYLLSENPVELMLARLKDIDVIVNDIEFYDFFDKQINDNELKSYIFYSLIKEQGNLFAFTIKQYSYGNLRPSKETPTFIFVNYFGDKISKAFLKYDKIKEKVK